MSTTNLNTTFTLENDINWQDPDDNNRTYLIKAIRNVDIDKVKYLLNIDTCYY